MAIEVFLEKYHVGLSEQSKSLIGNFFIAFSRFESALKASGFTTPLNGKVQANWDAFIASIKEDFNADRTEKLSICYNFLVESPARIQIIEDGIITWRIREFPQNTPELNKLGQSIRDIRNNLFHGGKFHTNFQPDVSRDYQLIDSALVVLDEWLNLNDEVQSNFNADFY